MTTAPKPPHTPQSPGLTVVFDAIIYDLQHRAGVTVASEQLACALHELPGPGLDVRYQVSQAARSRVDASVPAEIVRTVPSRRLERLRPCRLPQDLGPRAVFHSSYFRVPVERPRAIPSVACIYDMTHELIIPGLRSRVIARQKYDAMCRADAIVTISESTRRDVLQIYPELSGRRIEVVYNGVSAEFGPPASDDRRPWVLFVGSRLGYKNFDFALAVMERLPGYELHVAGGRLLRPEERQALERAVPGRYRVYGEVSPAQLTELYQRARFLLYPSKYEGFGMPPLEAMKCGCVPITLSHSSLPEVMGEAGVMLEREDAERAVREILAHEGPAALERLRQAGYAQAERFSWRATAGAMREIYDSLV